VDGAEVGVLHQADEVCLASLLQGKDGSALETQALSLVLAGDLTDDTLEGKLPDEELSALLVLSDLTESDGTRFVAVRLLDAGGGLTCGLSCQLLARLLTGGRLACGLFSACHCESKNF